MLITLLNSMGTKYLKPSTYLATINLFSLAAISASKMRGASEGSYKYFLNLLLVQMIYLDERA